MTATTTGAERSWPLSAAASAVLLDPGGTSAREVVSLTLKELVGRGAWRARSTRSTGRRGRRGTAVVLRPGPRPEGALPTPLDVVEAAIRPAPLDGDGALGLPQVGAAMRSAHGRAWAGALLSTTREELERAGLLERRSRLLRADAWTRTASGDSWAAEVGARCDALRTGLPDRSDRDPASAADLLARAGWLLLLVPEAAAHLPALREWAARRNRPSVGERTGSPAPTAGVLAVGGTGALTTGPLTGDPALADFDALSALGNLDGLGGDAGLAGVFDGAFDGAITSGDLGGGGLFDGGGGFGGGFDGGGGGGGDGGGGGGG